MRKWGFYFILLFMMFQLNCGSGDSKAGDNSERDTTRSTEPGKTANSETNAVPVEVTPMTRGDIASFLLYNSTLETEEMADVYSRLNKMNISWKNREPNWSMTSRFPNLPGLRR
jgi:hypothetical protein